MILASKNGLNSSARREIPSARMRVHCGYDIIRHGANQHVGHHAAEMVMAIFPRAFPASRWRMAWGTWSSG
jgi:hypothetical protein